MKIYIKNQNLQAVNEIIKFFVEKENAEVYIEGDYVVIKVAG